MKNILIYSLIVLGLVSCKLDGVEDQVDNDSIIENLGVDTIDTAANNLLLTDTVDGHANHLVYQRDDGLRVEWDIKNDEKRIQLNDVVMVNYTARVAAGEVYDTNKELGKPVPLKSNIGMMVPGWEAGLLQMHEGDKGRIMIPAAQAYGEDGYMTIVPPKADLIVDIEIVSIIKPTILEDGVKVYKWQKVSKGETPKKNQVITFDYFAYKKGEEKGMYDNSYQNEAPFSFKFKNATVVDGLHIGMSILKEGESAFIEIPAKAAYGSKGLLDLVPKNTDIVYDVRIGTIL
ncbi:MAG: FKBP-type peptidyl-prolyl cis-trans isomerase [Arenicella sp.]|jgi:FKBP-type peptidyl-prolyl cis-trans isomerase